MAKTEITKQLNGDQDIGNRVGAEYSAQANALTSFMSVTWVLGAGTKDDTRVCKIDFDPSVTDAQIATVTTSLDSATRATIKEVKKTIGLNNDKDIPALVEEDKYIALASYELVYPDGRVGRDYIRIPYCSDETRYVALKTFLESELMAGTPAVVDGNGAITTPAVKGKINFKGNPDSYKLLSVQKVKDRS